VIPLFRRILIANRGEIAVRIVRACKELGVQAVTVHSQADADSLHVRYADDSICIGTAEVENSYLHIPSIMSAAEISDVEAIHPGYGFLAENAHFAEVCESCNITFIGPPPEAMRRTGDKASARKAAQHVHAPIVPGSDGPVAEQDEAIEVAHRIGFPVLIKAVNGGGGRGMRVAHNDVSLTDAFHMAQSEAASAFGSPEVYIEKSVEDARHVEVQILADTRGRMIHLGERECTIQRRYQKLIEEAPSPVLSPKLRNKLGETALRIAGEVGYVNAGTAEFLIDKNNNFYFIEFNSRIQVEHPVTEAVTGIDLIKQQLRIAAGEKLRFKQKDIHPTGCAIECRIYAEDPDHDWRPSPGRISALSLPGGPGIRIDTHIYEGYVVPQHYDPMLMKVVAWGNDRQEAIGRAQRALDELVIDGVAHTGGFSNKILRNYRFRKGDFTTDSVNAILQHEHRLDRSGDGGRDQHGGH